jgi:phosphoenolpyruvate carboxykinase (GTP)
MLAFMGYNMSDHFQHWLDMGAKLAKASARLPKIYCVNWFRKGADGKFVWPGYGDNMRVLEWLVGRIEGKSGGQENAFGISPRYDDLHWGGLAFERERYASIIDIDPAAWRDELALHSELFDLLAYHLPAPLLATKARFEARLNR